MESKTNGSRALRTRLKSADQGQRTVGHSGSQGQSQWREEKAGVCVHHVSSNRGPQQSREDPVLVRKSHDNKQVGSVKTDPGSCPKQVVAVLGSEAGFPRAEGHRWGPQGPSAEAGGRKPQS